MVFPKERKNKKEEKNDQTGTQASMLRTLIESGCGHSLERSKFKELQKICRA